jgi:hypothetical protein
MKGGRRRRAELRAMREAIAKGVSVDPGQLAPDGSYSRPDFVARGYYVDKPFECQHCGEPQTWTAAQQKWWYEVAKGGVWTTARLCRPCRRRERERREEARRVHLEGLARKRQPDA